MMPFHGLKAVLTLPLPPSRTKFPSALVGGLTAYKSMHTAGHTNLPHLFNVLGPRMGL